MPKKENIVNTYIHEASHQLVKGFAGFKGMALPDAYDKVIDAGLAALGYDVKSLR